jgi:hypothetical protein
VYRPRLGPLREPMVHHQVSLPLALNGVEPKRGDVQRVAGLHLHLQPPHLRKPRMFALVGFPEVNLGHGDVVKRAAAVGSLLDVQGFEISRVCEINRLAPVELHQQRILRVAVDGALVRARRHGQLDVLP